MELEFKLMIEDFKDKIQLFQEKYNLDAGNIFIRIDPSKSDIGGMKDGFNNRIADIGFLPEIDFILVENG